MRYQYLNDTFFITSPQVKTNGLPFGEEGALTHHHTSIIVVLGAEVYPKVPRKKSKVVPEGNGPVFQDASGLLGGITLEEILQIWSEVLDKSFDNFCELDPENPKEMRATRQRLAGLEQDVRHPRLVTEADVPTDTKIRKRTEDAAADQAKHGDSCSAKRLDAGPRLCV